MLFLILFLMNCLIYQFVIPYFVPYELLNLLFCYSLFLISSLWLAYFTILLILTCSLWVVYFTILLFPYFLFVPYELLIYLFHSLCCSLWVSYFTSCLFLISWLFCYSLFLAYYTILLFLILLASYSLFHLSGSCILQFTI